MPPSARGQRAESGALESRIASAIIEQAATQIFMVNAKARAEDYINGPAVLETAFDSTRPGGVRALVQRNIFSFDGSRVLIQRGSRLFGEYEAGINPGERRARITWTRLLRPDGVSINLASPASDPLGRAGVAGDVDSRFFARFGGALLQTVLGIGASVATSEATRGVIVALPGSTQNVTGQTPENVRPVLRIDHGTSVSVFVARDLDFSTVDN